MHDPRWDRQVESRASYYALLWRELELPVAPLHEHVVAAETDESLNPALAADVLQRLAALGVPDALRIVGHAAAHPPKPTAFPKRPQLDPSMPHAELLALATGDQLDWLVRALRLLGQRGDTVLLDEAEGYLREHAERRPKDPSGYRRRSGYIKYLEALPAAVVLERARGWYRESQALHVAAQGVLERHAEPTDVGWLVEDGERALGSADYHRVSGALGALLRWPTAAATAYARGVHDVAAYSYARWEAVRVLCAGGVEAADRWRMQEALWDCDSGTRELAATYHAEPVSPRIRRRLAELAAATSA